MAANQLFAPNTQATVSITTSNSSQRVALGTTAGSGSRSLRIKNIDATNVAYINFGDSTVAATVPSGATAGSMPVGAGETVGITIPGNATHVAAINTAGTPVVFFTPGEGL